MGHGEDPWNRDAPANACVPLSRAVPTPQCAACRACLGGGSFGRAAQREREATRVAAAQCLCSAATHRQMLPPRPYAAFYRTWSSPKPIVSRLGASSPPTVDATVATSISTSALPRHRLAAIAISVFWPGEGLPRSPWLGRDRFEANRGIRACLRRSSMNIYDSCHHCVRRLRQYCVQGCPGARRNAGLSCYAAAPCRGGFIQRIHSHAAPPQEGRQGRQIDNYRWVCHNVQSRLQEGCPVASSKPRQQECTGIG
jgi:hypothetical protein